MSRFFSTALSALVPYTPGEQPRQMQYIKLNTNESPYPPSPKAVAAADEAAKQLQLYPDPTCKLLIDALAKRYGLAPDQILVGNGSDEILFFAFSAFCDAQCGAAFADITYGFYEVFAALCKVPFEKIPLLEDFSVRAEDYLGIGKTIFLANPNAPTGMLLGLEQIRRIADSNPDHVLVVDEAYIDFGGQSAVSLLKCCENLLVVQTFSKSRSMAGARLGMAFGSPELIADLNRIKYSLNPYNINRMTLAAGVGTLADAAYTEACCQRVAEVRAYTAEKLKAMGYRLTDSCANFLFAMHPRIEGKVLYEQLKARGILVRHFDAPRIGNYNRITIGTKEQMDALLAALCAIEEELR